MGGRLADALRAAWLPKITSGCSFEPRVSSPWRDI
jgi:hypothetical protein